MTQALNFVDEGDGYPIVLGHALGCDLSMWDEVASHLTKGFRVIRFDQLGHGKSPQISKGVRIEAFTDAVVKTLSALNIKSCLYAGVSMGAMVGLDLVSRYPHICSGVVLANTTHFYDEPARQMWANRIEAVTASGMHSIAEISINRWVSTSFQLSKPEEREKLLAVLNAMQPESYAAACEAVARIDFRKVIPEITKPVLLIAGDQDIATPPAMLEYLHQQIPSSQIRHLNAGHLSAVEQPQEFASAITKFHAHILKKHEND